MSAALDELKSRLEEIEADASFVVLAAKLRPRLGGVMNWEGEREVVQLSQSFIKQRVRVEGLTAGLLVRAMAAFERYLRKIVEEVIDNVAVGKFDEVPLAIRERNLVLTGRLLAAYGTEKDFQKFNYEEIVDNLASCKMGAGDFRLNATAFSFGVVGSGPDHVERALKNLELEAWWDSVGGTHQMQALLGTRKARETGVKAKEKLKELSRWRNHIAHGGDEEVSLSEELFKEAITFIALFSYWMDAEIKKLFLKKKK